MKKLLSIFVLASVFLTLGVVSAGCAGVQDICQWKTLEGNPLLLPLGNGAGCGLTFNTLWPENTDTSARCDFTGYALAQTDLYISIDNDITKCTLTNSKYPNGIDLIVNYEHINCAPVDPQSGLYTDLSAYVADGDNTLVCEVHDYGGVTYFDACVVSTGTTSNVVPEFGTVIGILTLVGALGVFFVVRRK